MKAAKRALVVVDMSFGTCSENSALSMEAVIRIMKETGADTLKIEGGEEIIEDIKKIVKAGIPLMGHLGFMPQSINKYGTYTVRAKEKEEVDQLINDAFLLEKAGFYPITLEKIPAKLAVLNNLTQQYPINSMFIRSFHFCKYRIKPNIKGGNS